MRTSTPTTRHPVVAAVLTALAAGTLALGAATPSSAHDGEVHEQPPRTSAEAHGRGGAGAQLARLRADLAPYRDVGVALEDGYVPVSACETSSLGGMGVHYLNPALVGALDPAQPTVLLYEPTTSGRMRLVGVEWFVPDADQDLHTDADRPALWGRGFDGPMLGHSPGMPVHYDLHVWLYEANPRGVFEPWNPRVTC